MPQFTLEYTNNIVEKDFGELFRQIHDVLVATLPTQLDACKSRAIMLNDYLVGDGAASKAFVYCFLRMLPGRAEAVITSAEEQIKTLLIAHFKQSATLLDLQITLEIANLSNHYSKLNLL